MQQEAGRAIHPSWLQRAGHEARQLLFIFLYLYICLGALLLYKVALLQAHGIDYAPYGLAAVKALILAKFMLIGHATHAGERRGRTSLLESVLYRSAIFFLILFVLSVLEEMITEMIHGRPFYQSLSDFGGGTWLQILATCILIWLILLPYFAFRAVRERLGNDGFRRLLLSASE